MSRATASDGTQLAFDVLGRPGATPVLLIQGLGADRTAGLLQRLALAPLGAPSASTTAASGGRTSPKVATTST